jgi:hypothetical protein
MFKTSSGGKPIDWAVGAMIYEINQERGKTFGFYMSLPKSQSVGPTFAPDLT